MTLDELAQQTCGCRHTEGLCSDCEPVAKGYKAVMEATREHMRDCAAMSAGDHDTAFTSKCRSDIAQRVTQNLAQPIPEVKK